jgi:protoheme ferro-lyase
MTVLLIILIVLVVLIVGLFALYKYKNQRPTPDYFEYYKTQDKVPEGKTGLFITSLIMTEDHIHEFWYNVAYKVFNAVVPWPFRILAFKDNGVALFDPEHMHAREEFTPARLVDPFGNDCDHDGFPYIVKYREGKITWVPPSKFIYLDPGYFLYKGRKGGDPTIVGKMANYSRHYYYDKGIVQKKCPHWKGSFDVINGAVEKLKNKYPDLDYCVASSLFHYDMKGKLYELLDAGCQTIVISALMPIYSHFEEFNSSIYHSFEYIHEWEQAHPGKKIKVIIAPQMGDFQPMRQAFLEMLKDRLDTIPEGSDVFVAVTVHGMPWDNFLWEAWLQLAPAYRDKLFEECRELLKNYKFGRTETVICQDEFSDPIWDPKEKYLSTNRAYWRAIKDGYDYAIGLPIEFIAENTDTMMHHAMKCYENFDQYDVEAPVDYPDWSVPYTMELVQGKTRVIYNGLPVGKYQKHVIEALYQAADSVLSKHK